MLVSGKESILDGIFRICFVPQEPESHLVKHRQVARHDVVQFVSTLTKHTRENFSLLFSERCYCRHNVSLPSKQPKGLKTTHYLQHGWAPLLPGATQGPRQPVESGLTSLPANRT